MTKLPQQSTAGHETPSYQLHKNQQFSQIILTILFFLPKVKPKLIAPEILLIIPHCKRELCAHN